MLTRAKNISMYIYETFARIANCAEPKIGRTKRFLLFSNYFADAFALRCLPFFNGFTRREKKQKEKRKKRKKRKKEKKKNNRAPNEEKGK